jgi:hypothetical protein
MQCTPVLAVAVGPPAPAVQQPKKTSIGWAQKKPQHTLDPKKKPQHTLGREAFLLSHIKAPAQGGKAGSGEPLEVEYSKVTKGLQVNCCTFLIYFYNCL